MKYWCCCKYLLAAVFALAAVLVITCLIVGILKRERDQEVLLRLQSEFWKYGYELDQHTININSSSIHLYRIVNQNIKCNDEAILLVHGIFGTPIDWIVGGPNKALSYVLANRGYDVWMLDYNVCFAHNSNRLWHDIGVEDYPAILDHIQRVKQPRSITFIGQGAANTAFFSMAVEKPEYGYKIKTLISIAPIVYLGNSSNELLLKIGQLEEKLRLSEATIKDRLKKISLLVFKLIKNKCSREYLSYEICSNLAFGLYDYHSLQLDPELVNNASRYIPKCMNWMQLHHYSQLAQTGKFARYNYGKNENLKQYGTEYAPEYNMQNIRAPAHLIYSRNDSLTNEDDMNILCKNIKHCYVHDIGDKYTGLDHKYGKDAPGVINKIIMGILTKVV